MSFAAARSVGVLCADAVVEQRRFRSQPELEDNAGCRADAGPEFGSDRAADCPYGVLRITEVEFESLIALANPSIIESDEDYCQDSVRINESFPHVLMMSV